MSDALRDSTTRRSWSPTWPRGASSLAMMPAYSTCAEDRLGRSHVLRRQQDDERDADGAAYHPRWRPATACPAQGRGCGKEERAGQNHRQKPPRHPEMVRDDANLVEEEEREKRDGREELRGAPEALARDERKAEQRREKAGNGQVEVRERPQRVGVPSRQHPLNWLPQEQRIHGRAHDRQRQDVGATLSTHRPSAGNRAPTTSAPMPAAAPAASNAYCHHGEVTQENDRKVGVVPHRPTRYATASAADHRERQQKGPADAGAPGKHSERQRREHAGDAEHGVEAQEQQQAEQGSRDRREERDRRRRARGAIASSAAKSSACITTSAFG